MMDTSERWRINQVLSINAAIRQLKKEENGLYNCICSILTDANFVTEVAAPSPANTPLAGRRPAAWWWCRNRQCSDCACSGAPDASIVPGVCQPTMWALVCASSSVHLLLQIDRRARRQLEFQPHTAESAPGSASRRGRRLLRGGCHTTRQDIPSAFPDLACVTLCEKPWLHRGDQTSCCHALRTHYRRRYPSGRRSSIAPWRGFVERGECGRAAGCSKVQRSPRRPHLAVHGTRDCTCRRGCLPGRRRRSSSYSPAGWKSCCR